MSSDYHLVVIGSTPEAIEAAVAAARLKARVALVEQPCERQLGTADAVFQRNFSQMARLFQQLAAANHASIGLPTPAFACQLSHLQAYAQEVTAILSERHAPPILSALGIDVISGSGEFCRLPQLAFVAGKRRLRSRAYLIATGFHPTIPEIPGLAEVGCLISSDLSQAERLSSLPQDLAIVGYTAVALELAVNLRLIGKNVTLILEKDRILPQEEPEAARLIQAQLEAVGVRLLVGSPVMQVRQIEGKKWLQAGDWAIESDEIILATPPVPNVEGLNLAGVGVKWGASGIERNDKLQTANPRIYACGSAAAPHLSRYEAAVAVKNALFFPWFRLDARCLPQVIFTHPPLARVGMTEGQARQRYGRAVFTAQQSYKIMPQAQILGETTGFCKLVAHRNGKILGAHAVGAEAGEFIGIVALAMQQNLKVSQLANLFLPYFTLSAILQETAREWQYQRRQGNALWQNLLQIFLNGRRS
jgi:pyruvate/2-oxoglutarate dehydrogenase complex dihydrolipoamide dehydrogenase (E3) component